MATNDAGATINALIAKQTKAAKEAARDARARATAAEIEADKLRRKVENAEIEKADADRRAADAEQRAAEVPVLRRQLAAAEAAAKTAKARADRVEAEAREAGVEVDDDGEVELAGRRAAAEADGWALLPGKNGKWRSELRRPGYAAKVELTGLSLADLLRRIETWESEQPIVRPLRVTVGTAGGGPQDNRPAAA